MEFHEVANIFPMMSKEEFDNLCRDIAQNGQIEPIWTYQNKIIDGRNRYNACIEVGINPRFKEWGGNGSLVSFVASLNLHRRHLTASQRAVVALKVMPDLEEEAKERMVDGVSSRYGNITIPRNELGTSREKAGEIFNVSPSYIQQAKKIENEAPELLEKVRSGELTLSQAKKEISKERAIESRGLPVPDGKYSIIYADPPWKYTSGDQHAKQEQETVIGTHYPSMTITEICNLPIEDMATDNAVLFLWTTSPLLEDAFKVINAWGFNYKASIVWNKLKHNVGHYVSVRHEFLLICTRGSFLPDSGKLLPSVVEIERTKHSEKPEYFREMIDSMYQEGKRIELFARSTFDGWDAWGNEV